MTQDHLDPEIVAAWVDGSLDSPTRAQAEAHAADCARCQAVLAAMIRTEPVPAPRRAWFGAPLRWLVPLVTATAVAGIWVLVSPGVTEPPVVTPPAAKITAPAPEAPQAASARQAPVDAVAELPSEKREGARRSRVGSDRAESKEEAAKSSTTPAAPPALAETVTLADQQTRERRAQEQAAQLDRLQAKPSQAPLAQTQSQVQVQTPAVQSPPAPAPAPPAPPPPPAALPRADSANKRQEGRGAVGGILAKSAADFAFVSREVAAPDQSTRWRYGPPAAIHRSTDGGKTWILQPSGVTTELLAASAPSSTVCWVVGRAGVVLLSTDGATWRRLTFPEGVDLASVTATDARTASVTTADGRVFRTADGGQTWTR